MAEKMMAIIAQTINGEIQEFPPTYYFPCSKVKPQGEAVIREFDTNTCIVNRRVYLVEYGGNIFGSLQFETFDEFITYKNDSCNCCNSGCSIMIDGCPISIDDCILMYKN